MDLLVGTTPGLPDQISQQVGPAAWYKGIPGRANSVMPAVRLKDPSRFPNQKQYLIKEETCKRPPGFSNVGFCNRVHPIAILSSSLY